MFTKGYKQSAEHTEKIRRSNIGKKRTDETKRKLRESKLGRPPWNKGLTGYLSGESHYNWKGGITTERTKVRNSLEMKLWRTAIFERDHYTCSWCGAKNGNGKRVVLHADHIRPFCSFPDLRFSIENGRTLCVSCHRKTDTFGSKAKRYTNS